jgi:uncharacterized membrane protein YeaQ/YmgE (transglycosylase-associated protein family)
VFAVSILAWIIVGIGAGWLARSVAPGQDLGGLVRDFVIGATGAVSAGWIFQSFGNPTGHSLGGSIVIAFVGAVVFLRTAQLLAKKRAKI